MRAIFAAAAIGLAAFTGAADAKEPGKSLGFYVGGEIGTAETGTSVPTYIGSYGVNKTTTGWTVFAGIRPLKFLGAELSYIDFGNAKANNVQVDGLIPGAGDITYLASAKNSAFAGYAVGYLPIAHSHWDVVAKAGYARLDTKTYSNGHYPSVCTGQPCVPIDMGSLSNNYHSDAFAYGFGAQYRLGSLGVRAEFQKVANVGIGPHLLSVGLTWKF